MSNISIRPAKPEDLPNIVAMRNALNRLELAGCPHASITRLTLEEFIAHWGPTMGEADYCWRIVEEAGKPIGFGMLYLLKPRVPPFVGFVQWAYVEEGRRRAGVGRRLVDELFGWAKQNGAGRVELQFIDGNQIAERFWKKLGFEPYARKCVLNLQSP